VRGARCACADAACLTADQHCGIAAFRQRGLRRQSRANCATRNRNVNVLSRFLHFERAKPADQRTGTLADGDRLPKRQQERVFNMRKLLLAAAVSATALTAGYGAASAQVAIETPNGGVYIGPTYDPYYYGYYDTYDGYDVRARNRYRDRDLCGRNAHWNGEVCLPGRR
jgi:hypothetical protein